MIPAAVKTYEPGTALHGADTVPRTELVLLIEGKRRIIPLRPD